MRYHQHRGVFLYFIISFYYCIWNCNENLPDKHVGTVAVVFNCCGFVLAQWWQIFLCRFDINFPLLNYSCQWVVECKGLIYMKRNVVCHTSTCSKGVQLLLDLSVFFHYSPFKEQWDITENFHFLFQEVVKECIASPQGIIQKNKVMS